MLKYETIRQMDQDYVVQVYRRFPALFVQGSGCSLWDNRGKEYLDLLAGIAVCLLGHCHPAVISAITRQAQQLMVASGYLLTAPQALLARRLAGISGMDRVFFCACGATANETGIKIARKHGNTKRPEGDHEIVALHRSFHGRTMGALSATGQRKLQRPFEPLLPGFRHIEAGDMDALREAVSHKTAAIYLEPVQGEGGVHPLSVAFVQEARRLATEHNALLMFDEVQTGMGRTGEWFAFQHFGVVPDVLALAKGLGSGMPIGACVVRGAAATLLEPGEHGSTFGGNPLACSVAGAVIDTVEHTGLLDHVRKVGPFLQEGLRALGGPVREVRGMGLMIGVELEQPAAKDVVRQAFEKGLILNATDDHTLRIVPPLVITEEQCERATAMIAEVLGVPKPAARIAPAAARPRPIHDFLSIDDADDAQLAEILDLATHLKERRALGATAMSPVEGRSVAMIFEKPSLRTRVTFESAIRELGGDSVYLTKSDIGLGQREAVKDVAQNLSRWCSLIVARLYWHRQILELAEFASVPVVNALTEWEHPCQALADMLTVRQAFGADKVKIAYVGDGNNVARSLAKLATRLGYPCTLCGPSSFRLEDMPGLDQTEDLEEGLDGARVVYTDVWISMGDEHEQEQRLKVFRGYQVNGHVMGLAAKDAIFLHCLPARRGYEVTDEVIDSPASRINDQAENRLHVQKALMMRILGVGF
jgi:ornithine carbamoyltransferase